ncbi:hypothetical protein [Bradyrhizobium genosp. A]|uniref:hypothetical protein n=1 Tax=Bradyrhizobium genosp. A TaxID=83626 RepID=UPI003CEEBB48
MTSFVDVCRFNPTAGGTSDWTFSTAVQGYQGFTLAGAVNGAKYRYRAESADLTQWEIGTGVYNSGTGVLTRATVLYNSAGTGTGSGQSGAGSKINFTLAPQVGIVALAEDFGPLALSNATVQSGTLAPTGTTSTSGVMMGLGSTVTLTPTYSGRVMVSFQMGISNSIASSGNTVSLRYGTGSAPANGAAITGTQAGSIITGQMQTAAFILPTFVSAIITGLTPGTAYWFDLSLTVTGGTGTVNSVSGNAMEF